VSGDGPRAILVTGATSALGHAIVGVLANDVRSRIVLAAHASVEPAASDAVPGVDYVQVDLTHHSDARELLLGAALARRIDTVVHVPAGRGAVGPTRELLSLCEEQPHLCRFVLCSSSDVYRVQRDAALLIDEDCPLELAADAEESVRDRAETDLTVCAKIGQSRLQIAVLRFAEILGPGLGSPLYDYLGSRVCLRPLGYDPMLNLLSLADAAEAARLAVFSDARGAFNVPGRDTLPLSELVSLCGRIGLPLPGPTLAPLYRLRSRVTQAGFRYAADRARFHYGGILDGTKAAAALGYRPRHCLGLAELFAL
jgi:UDP-glucose 4-epimerase